MKVTAGFAYQDDNNNQQLNVEVSSALFRLLDKDSDGYTEAGEYDIFLETEMDSADDLLDEP